MADVLAAVTSAFATDLFGSLKYPFRIRVDGNAFAFDDDDSGEEDAEIEWLSPDFRGDVPNFEADVESLLDAVIGSCLDQKSDSPFIAEENDEEAEALVAPYIDAQETGRARQIAAIKARMSLDNEFEEKLLTFFKSRLSVGIDWIEAELSKMPNSAMGNPMTLTGLEIGVRAKVKACIRIFGRKYCTSVTSPWMRFEGEKAALFFDVVGMKIFGRGRVSNLDFVIKIRILGREFKIKIGVTKIVNGQLAKQRPMLADFGGLQIKIPGVNLSYKPKTVQVPASASDTIVQIDGDFS